MSEGQALIVGTLAVIAALTLGVVTGIRANDRSVCAGFGQQSGREVKFVEYTFWQWDCLTPQRGSDQWISIHNLREFAS